MALRLWCLLVLVNTISRAASLDLQIDSDTSLGKPALTAFCKTFLYFNLYYH